jgi:hypothetical protein
MDGSMYEEVKYEEELQVSNPDSAEIFTRH